MKQVGNTILAKGVNHILAKRDNSAWPKGSKLSGFSNHWSESVRAYYTKVQYKYKCEDGNYLLWLKRIGYAEAPDYVPTVISVLRML